MMKKLLFTLLIIFSSFIAQSQITLTTTSSSSTWSPTAVTNSGATLSWTASGPDWPGSPVTIPADNPSFNFNGNTGTITVVVSSADNLVGLTNFRFLSGDIQTADVNSVTSLDNLFLSGNNLATLDVSSNTLLTRLLVSNNVLTTIDISNNALLDDLRVPNNALPSVDLDAIVNNLDAFGLTFGTLGISGNAGGLTTAAQPAYDNLIAKGWTIDVSAPVVDTEPPVIGVLNAPTNVLQTTLTLDWTAATDNVGVTNYSIFQDNVLLTTIGNVLTYDVTGLTANTNYDFYITALDNENNESANSNTQNITTLPTSSTMTLTTTSSSTTWSPAAVSNSGATLSWTASGPSWPGSPVTIIANDPTFNFNGNTGTITVVVSSTDNFSGLTNFRFLSSDIQTADVNNATSLDNLFLSGNNLAALDVSNNTLLSRLLVSSNILTTIDISNNALLDDLRVPNNALPSVDLDAIVNNLDAFGLSFGTLGISGNAGGLTTAAQPAYDNLIAKGWTIDVSAPVVDTEPPVIGVLNAPTNVLQTTLTLDWTAATDNVGVTNYSIFQDNVLLTTIGNVLTYDVTGLTANTNYDFHITALDNEGNESANSNVQNVTTAGVGPVTMTLTTTSSSTTWSPAAVTNSGATLSWTASGPSWPGSPVTIVADDPTFNFNGNTGTITVVVSSTDNFTGLTNFRFLSSDIQTADVNNATSLDNLFLSGNNLSSLDVSANALLSRLLVSTNILDNLDISNNPLIDDLRVPGNNLPTADLDGLVNNLDAFGLTFGTLEISGNTGSLTSAAQPGYDNLIAKGWTIDVSAPVVDTEPPAIGVLNAPTNVLQTTLTLDWVAATDNVGVTNYSIFQDNVLLTTIGNVLTYNVTGLTANTNYNFHITALDNAGNESANSNVQNITTADITTTMTLTTTSSSSTWSPAAVTNSGATLSWTATGPSWPGSPVTIVADVPIFNFNGNTGIITVVVSSTDNFNGLTNFRFLSSDIQTADVNNATSLDNLFLSGNNLATLDVSNNTLLSRLLVSSNVLTNMNITNNPLLDDLRVPNNALPSADLDAIVNNLDGFGLSNGNLEILGNTGSLTVAALVSYNNLIGKGWTIDVPPPPPSSGPEINITGNGISIPSGNTPIIADDTDFGQVAIGTPVIKTYTIENLGDADLTIVGVFPTNAPPYVVNVLPASPILPATSTTLQVTYTPTGLGIDNIQLTIINNDVDEGVFALNLTGEGVVVPTNEIINVLGNGISIANGDLNPDVADGTDFEQVTNNDSKTNTFTIQNDGTDNLTVTSIVLAFGGATEFSIDNESEILPTILLPGENMTFDVIFIPTATGIYNAVVEIANSDTDQNPFQYAITGEGAEVVVSGDIMITQYYEGTTNSKWIEVKNISGAIIPAGTYFIAQYNQTDIANISFQAPTASESIPEMAVDEVLLFKNVATPALPGPGNLGGATQIDTSISGVCDFDGNDVILISETNDTTCYANRQDIVGTVPASTWGENRSFIRGGVNESPEADFDENNWILLSLGADVDVADPNTNIALGSQELGTTIWTGTWSSLTPDRTRLVEIASGYTASDGGFTADNLIINSNLNFDNGTTNSVVVHGDLTINGTFNIGDQESLVMYDPSASITGSITKFENSTTRNNEFDFTYWSSPITSANIGTIFSGVTPNRIFLYDQLQSSSSDPNDPTYWDTWMVASGPMINGQGYAAEGPTGTTGVHNISFTGTPNNGLVAIELNLWPDGDLDNDFNLIGNPYPSAINIDLFFGNNGNIDPTAYLWTHFTPISGGSSGDFVASDYALYNLSGGSNPSGGAPPTNNIGSSQGFFVRATGAGFATFNNNIRIPDANDQFFKTNDSKNIEEKDRIWLNIVSDQGGVNQLLVAFMEEATEGVDRGYDALSFKNSTNPIAFYSIIEDEKYTIQGLGTYSLDKTISLGFDSKVAPRTFTISIKQTEGLINNAEVYLVDNLLNVTHDLRKSDYQFEQTTTGENLNRFTLQFASSLATLEIDDILSKNEFIVSNVNESLKIIANQKVIFIRVYDMLGRILINENPDKESFYLKTDNVKNGTVLLIEATLENGSVVNKKTIKY